jgi:cytochrome P450
MTATSRHAPGPKGLPFFGSAFSMRGIDPLVYWQEIRETYGKTARLRIGPIDLWFFATPEAIHQVLVGKHGHMRKGFAYSGLKMLLGEGLITTDKEHWASERQRLNPVFAPSKIETASAAIGDACTAGMRELEAVQDRDIDIGHAMTRLTMRVISRAAFGLDLGEGHEGIVEAFDYAFAFLADITAEPVRAPLFVPTKRNRKYRAAHRIIDDFTADLIDRSIARPYASAMSGGIFDALGGIDRTLLRDEVVSLYFAGFETTARSMTFMMYLLALQPELIAALRSEAVASGEKVEPGTVARRLPVATEIVNETLRLFPPVAMLARQANSDIEIDGYPIRRNDMLVLCPYMAQRDPDYWPDGDRFRPDPDKPLAQRIMHRGAYIPFGSGPRICLGKHFALAEMAIAISMIARDFDWQLSGAENMELQFHGTLRPKNPLMMRLASRC